MARSSSTEERLRKLENLMHNSGATAGEKASAQAAWERIAGRSYSAADKNAYSARNNSSASRSYTSNQQPFDYDAWKENIYRAQDAARAVNARRNRQARLAALGLSAGIAVAAAGAAYAYVSRNRARNSARGGRAASDASKV